MMQQPMIQLENIVMNVDRNVGAGFKPAPTENVRAGFKPTTAKACTILFLIGAALNLCLLMQSYIRLRQIIRRGRRIEQGDYFLILVNEQLTPFNYGKYVVMPESDYRKYP
ncbi:MAG: hypothetical protein LBQ65_05500, partial [Tannerellaceae bacterium]|nr:hypothetical protein [Tannerellaceae bacterium]